MSSEFPNPERRPFGPERMAEFLAELARSGSLARSARKVGCTVNTVRSARKRDRGFDEAYEEALEQYRSLIEDEIHRRAIEGVDEAVFYQGDHCGDVRKYSDTLLAFHARRHIAEYRDKLQVDQTITGRIDHTFEPLESLPREHRDRLRDILLEAQGGNGSPN